MGAKGAAGVKAAGISPTESKAETRSKAGATGAADGHQKEGAEKRMGKEVEKSVFTAPVSQAEKSAATVEAGELAAAAEEEEGLEAAGTAGAAGAGEANAVRPAFALTDDLRTRMRQPQRKSVVLPAAA